MTGCSDRRRSTRAAAASRQPGRRTRPAGTLAAAIWLCGAGAGFAFDDGGQHAVIGSPRMTLPGKTITTADPSQVFGPLALTVGSTGGANTAFFSAFNDLASGSRAFPVAVTAHGELHSPGGQVFGFYGEAKAYGPGVATHEFDAFNESGHDAPALYPWDRSLGTRQVLPIALTCAAGGGQSDAACLEIGREGSTGSRFNFGVVMAAGGVSVAGLTVDATASEGPRHDLVLKNTGQGNNVALVVQTTGPAAPANPVLEHRDAEGRPTAGLNQGGRFFETFSTPPSSAQVTCSRGEFWDDENFHYVCTAPNHVKRVALTDF